MLLTYTERMLMKHRVFSFALWFMIGFLVSQLRIHYLSAYSNPVPATSASQVLQTTPVPVAAVVQSSTLDPCTLKFDKYVSSEIEKAFLEQAKHSWHDAKQICSTVMQWKPVIDAALEGSHNEQYFSHLFFDSTCSSKQVVVKIEPLAGIASDADGICTR